MNESDLSDFEQGYYKRQMFLKEVGQIGQMKLKNSSVLIVGAGGLGHPAIQYLASSGVGNLGILDFDKVELSNLHRQILFTPDDIGKFKAETAKERALAINKSIQVDVQNSRINESNIEEIAGKYNIILDCTDNLKTKFLIHDYCYFFKKDLVQASIYQLEGQMQSFFYSDLQDGSAGCLRCLWPEIPKEGCVKSCAEAGVIGSVVGVLGSMQAMETVKRIIGQRTLAHRKTLIFDLLNYNTSTIGWREDNKCPLCSQKYLLWSDWKSKFSSNLEISLDDIDNKMLIVNMTDETIYGNNFTNQMEISNPAWKEYVNDNKTKLVFVCNRGRRSLLEVENLRKEGALNTYSLIGGVSAL